MLVEQVQDLAGNSIQFFSGQRLVVIGKLPLRNLGPGKYTLEISVSDRISKRSLVVMTDFKVNAPAVTAAAATAAPSK
jgi:hypothetical protein